MNNREKLVVLTAMQKAVKQAVDDMRADVTDEVRAMYVDGDKPGDVKMFDEKIGTISVTQNKEGFTVTDVGAFDEWCHESGIECTPRLAVPLTDEQVLEVAERYGLDVEWVPKDVAGIMSHISHVNGVAMESDTGEEVPGVEWSPASFKGIMVKENGTLDVLYRNGALDDAATLLLEGGGR